MSLIKQYLIQCLTAAANSLRLNTNQIEIVALLKEEILTSQNLTEDIRQMKKITELSTLAIKLSEILNYLESGNVNFFKVSEIFKEHSRNLIRDLSILLDSTTPNNFKSALEKIKNSNSNSNDIKSGDSYNNHYLSRREDADKLKEKFILEDDLENDEQLILKYEASVLSPIKPFDDFLNRIQLNNYETEEISYYINTFTNNMHNSRRLGFELLANMHLIIKNALEMIKSKKLSTEKSIIDGIRACLIVIAAVVKKKEIDITNFLNKAENLNKKLNSRF